MKQKVNSTAIVCIRKLSVRHIFSSNTICSRLHYLKELCFKEPIQENAYVFYLV